MVFTTASEGDGVDKVLKAILKAGQEHERRVSTATLNMVLKEATAWKAPPTQRYSQKKGKIYYATQVCEGKIEMLNGRHCLLHPKRLYAVGLLPHHPLHVPPI